MPIGSMLVVAFVAAQSPVVARTKAPAGAAARREAMKSTFDVLPANADLRAGELLLPLPGTIIQNAAGDVELVSRADFAGDSPNPILETALTLNAPNRSDMDFTLDRGRIDATNRKASGAATVTVRIAGQTWTLTLDKPGDWIAIEVYGRWLAGTPFRPEFPKDHVPRLSAVMVSPGGVEISNGITATRPTTPTSVQWNSTDPQSYTTARLPKVPEWAQRDRKPPPGDYEAALAKFRDLRAGQPADAVAKFLASESRAEQRIALVMLGATDDLETLAKAITAARTAEAWDFGMGVVRHWLGREAGQDKRLYEFLVRVRDYTPPQAATLIRMLNGFDAADSRKPETYEVLIEYLLHEKAAIRNLAAWHLVRMAPAGKGIPLVPNASKAEVESLYSQWKALIPPGQVPKK